MSNPHTGAANRPVKAALCRYFSADGKCFFGDSCQFVHAKAGAGTSQSGEKGFTVLPSTSGFPSNEAGNKYNAGNTETNALTKNFAGMSVSGMEVSEQNLANSLPSKGNNSSRNLAGNQNYEFLPTATNHAVQSESIGGTTFFYSETQQSEPSIILPSYDVYPSTPSHLANVSKPTANSFFISSPIRQDILNQHSATLAHLNPEDTSVPHEVESYHTLVPLEPIDSIANQQSRRTFGCITSCYKCVHAKDGLTYVLRRMHGVRLTNTKAKGIVDEWRKLQHSNLVHLREVFTTKAFDDNSLVFVYDYHPGAETMTQKHFSQNPNGLINMKDGHNGVHLQAPSGRKLFPSGNTNQTRQQFMPERIIWNYIIQISSVLRSIHSMMLACRVIEPSKILVLSNSSFRLRINGCGIFDVLDTNNSSAMVQHFQQEDLIAFGRLVLILACHSLQAVNRDNIQQSMEFINLKYSNDLKNLIVYLLRQPPPMAGHVKSINDVMPMIGARFYTQLDATQVRCDVLQGELAKEMENSRLFRLLCKMGCINERPEFNMDPSWSETGDRYLIKLFRDYLFHQVTETGEPWLDMSHIISALNKLDSGSPEQICLISRDEQSVLVVSYHDLKACFDGAFNELTSAS